jgi:hypothetical protein
MANFNPENSRVRVIDHAELQRGGRFSRAKGGGMNKGREHSKFRMEPNLFQRCRSQNTEQLLVLVGKKQAKDWRHARLVNAYQRKRSLELRAPAVETKGHMMPLT